MLGADAGGTKVEALAESVDGRRHEAHGPACNLQRLGNDAAADVLERLVRELLAHYPDATRLVLAAGLSGAGNPADREQLTRTLLARFNDLPLDTTIVVTHDADIALEGAFGTGSGFIVIAGTGSVVMARSHDGTLHRKGGWGYLLGDEGSGYAVGMAALRHLAAVLDDALPPSALSGALQRELALPDQAALIQAVYRENFPVQRAAPWVCRAAETGDDAALDVLTDQATRLAAQVALLARSLGENVAPAVALLGGLTRETVYRDTLTHAIRHAVAADGRAWAIAPLPCTPVEGALRMARRIATP